MYELWRKHRLSALQLNRLSTENLYSIAFFPRERRSLLLLLFDELTIVT
jgi:hypothetical protein